MPAETHQRSEVVTKSDVLGLLIAVLGLPEDTAAAADTSLVAVGCDDDLVLLDLWDAAIEEYGERTVADVDLDELRSTETLGGLAALIVAASGGPAVRDEQEDG